MDQEVLHHLNVMHLGKFLASKWEVTEQFRDYLCYAPEFVVYTDNNPLTYVLTSATLTATGSRPRLPIDVILDLEAGAGARSHAEYVTKWKTVIKEAYSLAFKSAEKSGIRGKKNYVKRVISLALKVGDHVLVLNLTPRDAPEKLRAFWEDEIQVVIARKGEGTPVYDVRPESDKEHIPKPWQLLSARSPRSPTPYHCNNTQPSRQEEDGHESDSYDDLPDGSSHYFLRGRDGHNELQVQGQSTSK
ncbi:hypothetical protein ACROYT_G026125 [Oculina patagonica]